MNRFESRFNPMMWFMAWVLAAVVAGTPALAAPVPTFSATASGTTSNLTLTTILNIGDDDVGRNGNVYLAATVGSALFLHNGTSWVSWSSGPLPVYSVELLANRSIEVVRNVNLSTLVGTQIYVGYGLSENDMLANRKFGLVYTVVASVEAKSIPWTQYVGVQYNSKSYATGIRDVGSAFRYGYDSTNPASHAEFIANVVPAVETNLASQLAMTIQIGGIASGRDATKVAAYLNSIKGDAGVAATDAYYQRALAIAQITGTKDKVYWQLGNEINSLKISENINLWKNLGIAPSVADISTIPTLVEYYIAPAVVGINKASQQVFGNADAIRIMLGSISGAANLSAQTFQNALLDYRVVGTYAPALAGKQVYEILDTVSIHYMMSVPGTIWKTYLDDFLTRRMGKGKIKRIMSTEELGIQTAEDNLGAAAGLRILSRYLSWWQGNNLLPDTSRVFYFGTGAGLGSIDAEFPVLHAFTGTNPLPLATDSISTVVGGANVERYDFRVGSDKKRIFIGFSTDEASAAINNLTFTETTWNTVTATAFQYNSTTGKTTLSPSVSNLGGGKYKIDFGMLTLGAKDTLLLMLESK